MIIFYFTLNNTYGITSKTTKYLTQCDIEIWWKNK